MDNPMRPTCTARSHTHTQTAAQTWKHKRVRPLPGRPTVRQSDTQIYPHSPHDGPARWLSSGLINSHQWPRAFGCHLNQNWKTQAQQMAHSYTLCVLLLHTHTHTHTCTYSHTHMTDKMCVFLCACTSKVLLNMHFYSKTKRVSKYSNQLFYWVTDQLSQMPIKI